MISIKEHGGSLASRSIMRSSFVTLFLLHNKLLQVSIWLGLWTVSLSRVLTMSKHWCVDLWSVCVSGFSWCSVFWEYPVYPNIFNHHVSIYVNNGLFFKFYFKQLSMGLLFFYNKYLPLNLKLIGIYINIKLFIYLLRSLHGYIHNITLSWNYLIFLTSYNYSLKLSNLTQNSSLLPQNPSLSLNLASNL